MERHGTEMVIAVPSCSRVCGGTTFASPSSRNVEATMVGALSTNTIDR